MPTSPSSAIFVGIDIGTSGCRAIAIDNQGKPVGEYHVSMSPTSKRFNISEQQATVWWDKVLDVLTGLRGRIDVSLVKAIAVDGTSSSILLVDKNGEPLCPALMYNDSRAQHEAEMIAMHAPEQTGSHGASSALAKLLYLQKQNYSALPHRALHQADWVSGMLSGCFDYSDQNNCLKLGFDAQNMTWPLWLHDLDLKTSLLPKVTEPGTDIGTLHHPEILQLGYPGDTLIISGTTDGVASFMATGANKIGDAVTSLGSTLTLKVLSDKPIFDSHYGVYSHKLGDGWLVGGASNCGGSTLNKYFTNEEMVELTPLLNPEKPTGLNYYPLPNKGERFPINDPNYEPVVTPKPAQRHIFLQGLLESIAEVERLGYQRLVELGCPEPQTMRTVGGGAVNQKWTQIRAKKLGVSMMPTTHIQPAYGTALLAKKGFEA